MSKKQIIITLIYKDKILKIKGILENRIFYPICKNCIYALETSLFTSTPIIIKLRQQLKRKGYYLSYYKIYCIKKRDYVGYPFNCKNKEGVPET